ncbi:hypothetical protein GCM10018793_01310 [Streptomyces sulfonofaciens]|uniref:Uncharacterized protein n=1 Tax=Streptomyces sulfonofaciens TaxID=68272 RepID=A0A919FNR5_9ACTN|nr:hypothetical protein GCM10018793_01310 [Streptomyces sulfonofaciens]
MLRRGDRAVPVPHAGVMGALPSPPASWWFTQRRVKTPERAGTWPVRRAAPLSGRAAPDDGSRLAPAARCAVRARMREGAAPARSKRSKGPEVRRRIAPEGVGAPFARAYARSWGRARFLQGVGKGRASIWQAIRRTGW